MALGLLSEESVREFLKSTIPVQGGIILDDLLEHTTRPIMPVHWLSAGYDKSFVCLADHLVGMSVEQLCRLQGTSLLGNYLHREALGWPMHPIVLWFEQWISREVMR